MILRQPRLNRRCSPQDGGLPPSSLIFSDLLYTSPITSHGGRMTDEILTIREVAELLKINEKTAYKLASAGKIPGFKVGGSWRFERQEIANWIKRKVEEQREGNGGA
jgi:excisionase family DNA binding protein